MINNKRHNLYLFYITFFAILAIFPVTTDYVIQTYRLFNIYFFTPHPSNEFYFQIILIIISVSILLSFLLIYVSNRKNNTEKLEYVSIVILRYSLAFVMIIVYGYCKIVTKQFQVRFSALDTLLRNVSDFDLTWYYYGRSNVQTFILGLVELIPGILLLFRRTTFIGAILLFPVIANIILLNIFNEIEYHTLAFAIMFLFFDIGILLFYRKEIMVLFSTAKEKLTSSYFGKKSKMILLVFKILFIGLIILRFGKGFYGASKVKTEISKSKSKCFGAYEIVDVSYNDKFFHLDSLPNYWKKLYFEKIDSRNTRLRDKNDSLMNIYCVFHENRDSITIGTYKALDEEGNPTEVDEFVGTYFLSDKNDTLILSGIKNGVQMRAVYKKLPIEGYDWSW